MTVTSSPKSHLTGGSGDNGSENHGDAHVPVGGVFWAGRVIEQVERRGVARGIAPPDYVGDGGGADKSNQTSVASKPDGRVGAG